MSIDILYIFENNVIMYLCTIKNIFDKSIVAYTLSNFIDLKLVLDSVNYAISKIPYPQRQI